MKRRWCSILAALALCLCLLPMTAMADVAGSGREDDPWLCGPDGSESVTAVLNGTTLTIRGTGVMMAPYSASDYPWYHAREGITKLVVESGVTTIGSYAFYGFSSLTEVSLPEGLTMICMEAFEAAVSLEKVTIPSSVSQVGDLAFNGCSALSEVTFLRRTPPIIGFNAFSDCANLQTINVPCGTGEAYKAQQYLPADAIREADHTPNGNGTCTGCGLRILAIIQGNGNTYYTDIREAFDAANAAADWSPDIILQDNVTLPKGESLTVEEGKSLTLICDAFTLSGSSEQVIDVYGSLNFIGGTLKNNADSGGVVNVHPGGMFTMYSEGTLEPAGSDGFAVTALGNADSDADSKAIVTISGGSVGVGAGGLNVGANAQVTLHGGTYGKIVAGGPSDPDTTVSGLFFPGSGDVFFKDGQPVVLGPEQHTLEGPVTVGKCTHIWGNFVQTEGETHSSTCLACGKTEEAVDCAYGDWTDAGDGTTHKGVCVCGREKTEEHDWGGYHTRSIDGKPFTDTIYQSCSICERKNDLGTVTRTADFTVPYGQTKGRVLSIVIEPEDLETRMKDKGASIEWYQNYKVKVTDTGAFTTSYNLPENLAAGEYTYVVSGDIRFLINIPIQVTVEPAPLPEDRIQVEEGPFTFSYQPVEPAVAIDGLTEGTDYTVEYQNNLDAGTASVLITGKGNYAGTVTKTFEIEKAALTFSGSLIVTGLTYGTPLSEAVVAASNFPQFNGGNVSGKWEIRSEDTPDVGKHSCTAVFVPSMDTMAKNCEPLTRDVTVTVNRKAFDTCESYVKVRAGKTMEVKLAALYSLPEEMLRDGELTAVGLGVTSDNDGIFDETPAAADGKLTITIRDSAAESQRAYIGFTVQSKNMECPYVCQVLVVDKFTPMLLLPYPEHTYDGQAPDLAAAISQMTAVCNGEPVSGTFAIKDPESVPVHVRESRSVTVVFTPEDTENYDTAEGNMWTQILPARITVRVRDQEAVQNGAMPELTYTVEGLAAGESLKTEPTPTCEARDTATAGTYAITAAGAEVPAGGDYEAEIAYVDGTLTVRASAPPDPDDLEVKLEVKEGFTEVPPALRALEHLNTPEKLTQVMRTLLTQTGLPEGNTAVYDVSLMVSNDGGQNWSPATPANFPSGGLTVTLPYPAGTDSTYQFTVVHMFTTTASGKIPGNTESPAVTNTEQGLRFTVTGLSPISVGWKAKTTGTGGSSSGGGGGGSGVSTYRVTVERTAHGKVTSDRSSAGSGSSVTLTVQPDRGYRLESLTVTDSRGNKLQLTDKGGGKYAFTMSGGNVTVKAVFAPLADSGACDGGAACPSRAFTDLKSGAWYHEAVDFVLRSGLMNGYGNGESSVGSLFGPEDRLSRAQFAQILYNKEGRPAGVGSAPFTDVAPDAWCAPAIAWAAERGIAGGYGGGLFGLDDAITREQLAVMLWRYAGSPAAPGGELSFMDAEQIGAQAREALGWAVQTGVMNGKTGGALDPKGFATRAQTAQMLKNFLENG